MRSSSNNAEVKVGEYKERSDEEYERLERRLKELEEEEERAERAQVAGTPLSASGAQGKDSGKKVRCSRTSSFDRLCSFIHSF